MKLIASDWGPDCNDERYLMTVLPSKPSDFDIHNALDLIGDSMDCEFKILSEDDLMEYIFGEKNSIKNLFGDEESDIPLYKFVNGKKKKLKKSMFSS